MTGYDLTALPAYIDENAKNIVYECIQGLDMETLTVQPNVKDSMNLNKIVGAATLQAGGCGWSPTGTTTLEQRTISVTPYKVQEENCNEDFVNTFAQVLMGAGASDESIPYEKVYVDYKVLTVQNAISSKIWNEDVATGDFSGFLEIITNDVPAGNKIARNPASVLDDVDAIIALMGVCSIGTCLHMSVSNYMALMNEIRDKNWFHITSGDTQALKFTYPGTNIMVVGHVGMGSSDSLIMANKANLVVGTDLESDFSEAKYKFKEWEDVHRFQLKFRLGTQIAIPEEVFVAE